MLMEVVQDVWSSAERHYYHESCVPRTTMHPTYSIYSS
jgi:hypothetical protein